jgi:uncharacterized protein (DUF983 family)
VEATGGGQPDTGLWDLPAGTWERLVTTMGRAFTRRCPYCGSPGIYKGYLELRESCPRCGVRFEREEGYFLGAYALNLVVAEFLGLGLAILLIFKTALRDAGLLWQELVAVALAVAFPLLFFPFSRTVWIAMDLVFHRPGRGPDRELRRHHVSRIGDNGDRRS